LDLGRDLQAFLKIFTSGSESQASDGGAVNENFTNAIVVVAGHVNGNHGAEYHRGGCDPLALLAHPDFGGIAVNVGGVRECRPIRVRERTARDVVGVTPVEHLVVEDFLVAR